MMDQLEGIKNSIKNCTEDNYEKTKYAEKQLLTKVGCYQQYHRFLRCNLLEIVLVPILLVNLRSLYSHLPKSSMVLAAEMNVMVTIEAHGEFVSRLWYCVFSQIYTESAVVKLPAVEEYLTTMIDVREIPSVQSISSLNSVVVLVVNISVETSPFYLLFRVQFRRWWIKLLLITTD